MKSFSATRNWSLSPMTFLISLPNVLRSTIGQKDLGWSYDCLLGLGITTVDDFLKWLSQYPRLIQVLAILMMLLRHSSYLRMVLRWFHDSLSGPDVEELLQLSIAHLNSSLEKGFQNVFSLHSTSSRTLMLTWWLRAVLKVEWRAFHKKSRVRHGWLLYLIASMASNLCLLT